MDIGSYVIGLLYRIPAILIGLSFHEWAHAYAAYKLGDPTARNLGRMTVNPFAHFDPIGLVMMLLVRFGWAKPVPINPRNFKKPRRDEIIVSLAGVFTNLLLAFISTGLYVFIVYKLGFYNEVLMTILEYILFINLGLCVFNLLPIPPLDGYRVLQCLLMRKIGVNVFVFLEKYGFIILVVLLISGALTAIMTPAVNFLLNGMLDFFIMIFA